METKINVAEILKDKPQRTILYDYLHNIDVEFDNVEITEIETSIWCTRDKGGYNELFGYSKLGTLRGWLDGLQILLPSKEMRDWSKFAWKKGDLLINSCGFQCIFKEWASDDYTKFNGCYSNSRDGYEDVSNAETAKFDKLDNNIAYGYVREIERKLGGILNLETLDIEKTQTEFKDGDIVYMGNAWNEYIGIIKNRTSGNQIETYAHCHKDSKEEAVLGLWLNKNDSDELRLATNSEKQQLFDALAKKGKVWDAENKQIVDIKKDPQFKPFEKVLVRDSYDDMWRACLFSHIKEDDGRYVTTCFTWKFCIPYEGNEYLLGTTKDVEV